MLTVFYYLVTLTGAATLARLVLALVDRIERRR